MLAHCPHCNVTREIKLDTQNDKPTCLECGKVTNFSAAMIKAMQTQKDYLRSESHSFKVYCAKCAKQVFVVVDDNEQILCEKCEQPVAVTGFMKNEILKAAKADVEEEAKEAEFLRENSSQDESRQSS